MKAEKKGEREQASDVKRWVNRHSYNSNNNREKEEFIYYFLRSIAFIFFHLVLKIFCGLLNLSHSIQYWHSKHVIDIFFRYIETTKKATCLKRQLGAHTERDTERTKRKINTERVSERASAHSQSA